MNETLIEFNPKLPRLSKNESQVLKLLVEAAKLIAPIYLEQEKQALIKIDSKELEAAAKKDSAFLSPYTVVEKINGKLVAIPYHIKYAELLEPVVERLEKAASLTDNREFKRALKVQAKVLLDGNYAEATITWLKMNPYILDISIGPSEYHSTQPFSIKASYQAWVGVINSEGTEQLGRYKDTILTTERKALVPHERINNLKNVKAKVDNLVLFAGLMAKTRFIGVNLPMDIDIVEKYGSEITLFKEANDLRIDEQVIPTFRKIFPKSFRDGFSREDLSKGNLSYVVIHELAHSYLYYRNAAATLKDLFVAIYELAATVLGFRMAGTLLLEDVITSKQLESMIIAYICRSYYLINKERKNKVLANPTIGSTIFINFLLESGALKQADSLVIPNFMKIFVSLQELSYILEHLLSVGTGKDAEILIKKYTNK